MKTVAYIQPLSLTSEDIAAIQHAAQAENFRFIDRLVGDWRAGTNLFDQSGEVLLGARLDGTLVAVGGVNIDPYVSDGHTGRIRHLYVLPDHRRCGIARQMVGELVARSTDHFRLLRLRTDTPEAAAFYEGMGFKGVQDPTATHQIRNPDTVRLSIQFPADA